MILIFLYNTVLLLSCSYALWRGGSPERIVALALLLASLATWALPYDDRSSFRSLEIAFLGVDLALLIGLGWVMTLANRYWPIWATAVHGCTIVIHLAKAVDPLILPVVYFSASSRAAYVVIAIMAVGAWRHHRRVEVQGDDCDWSLPDEAGSTQRQRP